MPDEKHIADRLGPDFGVATRAASISDSMVKMAREKGVSYICANCVKFWWGIERGHAQCQALFQRTKCGGPMSELAFPEYRGLIPRDKFPTICFVCGADADSAVHIHGVDEVLGVCDKHEEFTRNMRPRRPDEPLKIVKATEVPS